MATHPPKTEILWNYTEYGSLDSCQTHEKSLHDQITTFDNFQIPTEYGSLDSCQTHEKSLRDQITTFDNFQIPTSETIRHTKKAKRRQSSDLIRFNSNDTLPANSAQHDLQWQPPINCSYQDSDQQLSKSADDETSQALSYCAPMINAGILINDYCFEDSFWTEEDKKGFNKYFPLGDSLAHHDSEDTLRGSMAEVEAQDDCGYHSYYSNDDEYIIQSDWQPGRRNDNSNHLVPWKTSPNTNRGSLQKIKTNRKDRDRYPTIWEFLMRLLVSNSPLVKFEDISTGTFRIVDPGKTKELWATRSGRPIDLSRYNLRRSISYHFKTGALERVCEKNLIYRCGPQALKFLTKT